MNINVTVEDVALDSLVREASEYERGATIADLVAVQIVQKLASTGDEWNALRSRFMEIRDREIEQAVRPLINDAITRNIQQTNSYGEPAGNPTTLSEVIVAEVRKLTTQKGNYQSTHNGRTLLQVIVAEQVKAAFTDLIKAEVAQARLEVSNQIGQMVSQAVEAAMLAKRR